MNKYQTYCGVFLTLFLGSNLSLAAEPTPVSPSHAAESSSVEILTPKTAHQPNAGHYTPAKATPIKIISAAEHREAVKSIEEAQAAVASDPKLLDEYQSSNTLFFILLALTVVGLAGVYCWHHFGYLNRMTIKPKLYVGMGLLLSLTSAIGFQGVLFEGTLKKYAATATSAAEIEFLTEKAARTEFELRTVSHADTETQEKLTASFHKYTNAMHSDLGDLIDHETDVKVAEILSHIQELTTAYQAGFSEYARASSDIHSTQLRIKSVSKEYLGQLETIIAQLEVFRHEFASNNQDHLVPLLELIAAVEGVEISWVKSINEISNFAIDQDFAHVRQLEKNLGEMVATISNTEHLLTRLSSLPIDQNEVRDVLSNGLTNAEAIAQDCRNLFQVQKSNMALAIVNKGTVHKLEAETASVLGYKNQRVAATSATSKNVSYLLIGSAVLIGLMISIVLSDSVIKPIRLLLERLRSLADGDLTQTIKVDRGDEFGKLAKAYNDAVGQLHSMVSDVSGAAHEVAGAATQIAATSEQMARGLDNQQQQTNESSAAVEELSSSIASVSDKSCHAAEAANNSGTEAIE
ncbi:MAG: methyl-accepting chemotaxis protein, partial [Phycisphaerales bacterium]